MKIIANLWFVLTHNPLLNLIVLLSFVLGLLVTWLLMYKPNSRNLAKNENTSTKEWPGVTLREKLP